MPAWRTNNVVFGRVWLSTILGALSVRPAGALIVAGKIRLSKDPAYNPTPGMTIAALGAQEADFSGYPAGGIALVASAVVNLSPSVLGVTADALFIAANPTTVPGSAYGYWVDDGTNVVLGEAFGAAGPFSFGAPGDFLEVDLRVPQQLFQVGG